VITNEAVAADRLPITDHQLPISETLTARAGVANWFLLDSEKCFGRMAIVKYELRCGVFLQSKRLFSGSVVVTN
jgi:hypothetical protein